MPLFANSHRLVASTKFNCSSSCGRADAIRPRQSQHTQRHQVHLYMFPAAGAQDPVLREGFPALACAPSRETLLCLQHLCLLLLPLLRQRTQRTSSLRSGAAQRTHLMCANASSLSPSPTEARPATAASTRRWLGRAAAAAAGPARRFMGGDALADRARCCINESSSDASEPGVDAPAGPALLRSTTWRC